MNKLKNKNIFSNFVFSKNNSSIKNINLHYGTRIIDLFIHYPLTVSKNNLIDRLDKKQIDEFVTLDLKILKYEKNFNPRSPFKVICEDKISQKLVMLFFNMREYQIKSYLQTGRTYRISGKLGFLKNNFQIIHPNSILPSQDFYYFENIELQYDLVRKKINKKFFRRLLKDNLEIVKSETVPDEWIQKDFLKKEWKSFKQTLLEIHDPNKDLDIKKIDDCRKRLAFDELLSSYLTFFELKKKFQKNNNAKKITNFSLSEEIHKNLEFHLTQDQLSSLKQIKSDLSKKEKMYRLLQGDVGSGKTIIALMIIADVIKSGYQSVIMAPTEILAKQHFEYFQNHLSSFNISIELITGSTKNKERIYTNLKNNKTNILIGTHSVYNESVKFHDLGLIVIDEQHKFGVKQRINLLEKSIGCHTLIMSATPIPRSLSFSIYGEISISNIKTKPDGRKNAITSIISTKKINQLLEGIKRKIRKNEQIFWILPTIGSSESEKETVITRFEFLKKIFTDKVGILHGKMEKSEMEMVMKDFQEKKFMILISTTVIEVGINIPTATLMIVEQAERFGLAQLHQLRGRITRGNLDANCVLIHNKVLSEVSKQRLLILKNSNDGFKIAEQDLQLRGAGDFFGTNQSGMPSWKFFIPTDDYDLIVMVKKSSQLLVRNYKLNKEKIEFLKKVFYKDYNFKNFFSV